MQKKILVKGPVLSRSGYGEQARFALRALRSREDLFEIFIQNIPWGSTGHSIDTSEERAWVDSVIMKTAQYGANGGQFDVSLQITIPNEWNKLAPVNIGYTAGIETTKVAPEWVVKGNEMDRIIVVSEHSKTTYEQSVYTAKNEATGEEIPNFRVNTPIHVVNYPVRLSDPEPLDIEFTTTNNFLTISQWGPRKNVINTIKWFVENFKDNEDVGLVLKANIASDSTMDRSVTRAHLKTVLREYPDRKCKVYLVHGTLTEGELSWLYQHETMRGFINIAHGEGFGLPIFEAAYYGLPVITIPWSGQLDYIGKLNKNKKMVPRISRVDYDLKPIQKEAVWNGVLQEDSMWAYAREKSYKRAISDVYNKKSHYTKEATTLKNHILKNFTAEKKYAEFVKAIEPSAHDAQDMNALKTEILGIKNVKARASALKEALRTVPSQTEKLALLKDSFKGEKCYVVACGPTLLDHDQTKLKEIFANNLTLGIKQTFDLFKDAIDFHIYNCGNFKNYDYGENGPVVVEASTTPWKLGPADIKYFIQERDFQKSLSILENFDEWTLTDQPQLRPYGPGIMSEIVFYLAHHLGVSEIVTIGWDNKITDKVKHHFYETEDGSTDGFIDSNSVAENVPLEQLEYEIKITTKAIERWYTWLKKQNIDLTIISEVNPGSKKIPRTTIDKC